MTPQKFPVGIKRFKLPSSAALVSATLNHQYHSALSMIDLLADGKQFTQDYGINYTQSHIISGLTPITQEHYPRFKVENIGVLATLLLPLEVTTIHHTTKYQSSNRIEYSGKDSIISIPCFTNMEIQYDPSTHELIVHNCPYEGELVKSAAFTPINKEITTKVKALKAQLQMTSLVTADGSLKLPSGSRGSGTADRANKLTSLMGAYLNDTASVEDKLICAHALGQINEEYNYATNKYLLKFKDVSYKWPPGPKKQIYFNQGAYQLPENYLDWFDES